MKFFLGGCENQIRQKADHDEKKGQRGKGKHLLHFLIGKWSIVEDSVLGSFHVLVAVH